MTFIHRVKVGFMSSRIHEFIPKPIRCYKCQRYGPVATSRRSTLRCSTVQDAVNLMNMNVKLQI